MMSRPRATLPTDSWQWGDLVPSQVSTKAQGVRSSIRDAKEGAHAAASSAMKSATSAFSGSIEQLSILADQVRRSKLVDEAKLAALLPASLASAASGKGMDDRKLQLEQVVAAISSLPSDTVRQHSNPRKMLSNTLVNILWGDSPHPPISHMSKNTRFRNPDGSGNSVLSPEIGSAGMPYTRSVSRLQPEPMSPPDPGTVFDLLLSRDKFVPHPAGVNSFFLAFSNVLVHDIFCTSHDDANINLHSSYLDLQVVYGVNDDEVDKIRKREKGLLKPDAISDWRMGIMPPSTAAVAILFNRSHNYIAKRLYEVNENNRFDGLDDATLDEELFGIARLVNCGLYMNILLRDYLPVVLGVPASDLHIDSISTIKNIGGVGNLPRGVGNSMSAESSVLWRWHAAVSAADEKWMSDFFASKFPDRRPEELSPEEFIMGLTEEKEKYTDMDPATWPLHDWNRNEDGSFNDADLARVIQRAIVDVSGSFKARGLPIWFRAVEILSQIQIRETWALCTLNEYRVFVGLKPFTSFSEWNDDHEISKAAEMLYGHIDSLELYPGLLAEKSKPKIVGSGLCPGYTMSRGMLSDIVNLTRGDRFYTTDLSTSNMTSYGLDFASTCQPGSNGMMGKLIMLALPGQFPYNSVYALYPFLVPNKTLEALRETGKADQYDARHMLERRRWLSIKSFEACKSLLNNPQYFVTLPSTVYNEDSMVSAISAIPRWKEQVTDFYLTHTAKLLGLFSVRFNQPGETKMVDLVNLVNVVSAEFSASLFALPIREVEGNVGMSPQELHLALSRPLAFELAGAYTFIGLQTWRLEEQAESATKTLCALLRTRIHTMGGLVAPFVNLLQGLSNAVGGPDNISPSQLARDFYSSLFTLGMKKTDDLVHNCFRLMVSMTAVQTLIVVQAMQWLLLEENEEIRKKMHALALLDDASSVAEFRKNCLEVCRLGCRTPMPARFAVTTVSVPDGKASSAQLITGDAVFVSANSVCRDPSVFEEPSKFDPDNFHPVPFGLGDKPTQMILDAVLPALGRALLKLRNLRFAPSRQPQTVTDPTPAGEEKVTSFLSAAGNENPLPINTQMHVLYDGHVI